MVLSGELALEEAMDLFWDRLYNEWMDELTDLYLFLGRIYMTLWVKPCLVCTLSLQWFDFIIKHCFTEPVTKT